MALLSTEQSAYAGRLAKTAGAKAALAIASRIPPKLVADAQSLFYWAKDNFGPDNQSTPQPLLGGISLQRAREVMRESREATRARKNLFYIRVTDPNPPVLAGGGNPYAMFDLFALDVSYTPYTMAGEKINIGSAVMDRLNGTEHIELSVVTMDDEAGTLKRWFEGKCLQAAHPDGTFGLPGDYCITIEVVHAVGLEDAQVRVPPYRTNVMMRPQAMQFDLSRRDQALQELQLSFTQFDTFVQGGMF